MFLKCPRCLEPTDVPFPLTEPTGLACGCMDWKMVPTRAWTDENPPDCACLIGQTYRAIRDGNKALNSIIPDFGCMRCGEQGYRTTPISLKPTQRNSDV